jgi:hypothetical protein
MTMKDEKNSKPKRLEAGKPGTAIGTDRLEDIVVDVDAKE